MINNHTNAPIQFIDWNISVPPLPERNQQLQLLTITKNATKGVWRGQLGQHYIGWAPLQPSTTN